MIGIASGMMAIHNNRIIHRDLKPENVLLDEYADPKIADFGAAKVLCNVDETENSTWRGTMRYLAPEALEAKPVGTKADVHSFGMSMYVIETGTVPYPLLKVGQELQISKEIRDGNRPTFPPGTSPFIANLASRCWYAMSAVRPTFQEIVEELCSEPLLRSLPGVDLRVIQDFVNRTVPPEFRGFFRQTEQDIELLNEYCLAKRKFGVLPHQEEDFAVLPGDHSLEQLYDAYREAADRGDPSAMCECALYHGGSDMAKKLMKRAADRGCGRAGSYYAGMLSRENDAQEIAKYRSLEMTQTRCRQLFDFATAYRLGDGVERDTREAVRLYELTADFGHAESCFALAEIYRNGLDEIGPNAGLAVIYVRRNYEKGLGQGEEAREFLGLIQMADFLEAGFHTIPQNREQAEKLRGIASKKFFAFQQHQHAHRLWSGRGVNADREKARKYFDMAAGHGFPVRPPSAE
jgi:TPR repeat protein